MDPSLVVIIAGAALAGFVQGLSGFGFGLTAMAVWAWALEPRLAAVLAVAGALAGQVLAALTVRRGFDAARLAPFVAGGLLGLPLGLWLLPRLDVPLFRALLGGLLVTWCPLMLLAPRLPRITRGGRLGDAASGVAGGLMGGLGGFTGAIPTLWCTLRGFDKDAQRAVIQNFNLAMLSVTFAAYLWQGIVTPAMLPSLALVLPAMLLPALIGMRVYIGISEVAFRRIVLLLLTASGVALLVAAVPVLLAR
ncbi:MAG: sulfite exporter TauE/SafE family protein [Piscinibacter sp.]|uniref:sulfite exporter TauE/SafE family protein n=1 Tax=Piscinibacter sp. TaxID=1903157 RepID=UPI003D14934A